MHFCAVLIRIRIQSADPGEVDQSQCGNSVRSVSRNKNTDPRLKNDQLESFRQLYINSGSGHVRKKFYIFLPIKIPKLTGTLRFLKMWIASVCTLHRPGRSAKVRILILEAYGTYIIRYGTVCNLELQT